MCMLLTWSKGFKGFRVQDVEHKEGGRGDDNAFGLGMQHPGAVDLQPVVEPGVFVAVCDCGAAVEAGVRAVGVVKLSYCLVPFDALVVELFVALKVE